MPGYKYTAVVALALFRPSRHCRPTSVPARFFNPILPNGRHFATIITVIVTRAF
jgi:hypothetical protein